jgi:hypothetical protein
MPNTPGPLAERAAGWDHGWAEPKFEALNGRQAPQV